MQCFKTNEPPEEIKSKTESKLPEESSTKLKESPSTDPKNETQLPNELRQLSPNGPYVRKKYMRVRSKTSQSNQLDFSLSDHDISNSSHGNEKSSNN